MVTNYLVKDQMRCGETTGYHLQSCYCQMDRLRFSRRNAEVGLEAPFEMGSPAARFVGREW
ncbi:MAG: hypothetical protein GY702_23725 [Desulfobulbaceae bacterium]|nr:hypothetical protein [Desulfobulbaceae bacterium]